MPRDCSERSAAARTKSSDNPSALASAGTSSMITATPGRSRKDSRWIGDPPCAKPKLRHQNVIAISNIRYCIGSPIYSGSSPGSCAPSARCRSRRGRRPAARPRTPAASASWSAPLRRAGGRLKSSTSTMSNARPSAAASICSSPGRPSTSLLPEIPLSW